MTSIAQPTAPTPTTTPRIKVKVSTKDGHVYITSSNPPGNPSAIAQHMPNRRLRDRVLNLSENYGYNLQNCILHTSSQITNEQWSTAIAHEIIVRLANQQPSEVEFSAIAEGGYLAIGNMVCKLVPVEIAPQSRAMRAIHHRVVDTAQIQADALIKEAREQSASILTSATVKQEEAARILRDAQSKTAQIPPKWAFEQGIPLRFFQGKWELGFSIAACLKTFTFKFDSSNEKQRQFTTKYWKALPQLPIQTLLWLPINPDGSYTQTQLKVDTSFQALPHIKNNGACYALSTAPKHIKSISDLRLFHSQIQEAMQIVTIDSLYTAPEYWHPALRASIPAVIKDPLTGDRRGSIYRPDYKADSEETIKGDENADTWTATVA
jgi:hypothetical protein